MDKFLLILMSFTFISCSNHGKLEVKFDIPLELREVSGLNVENNIFWMINDSGNKPILYGLDSSGAIVREIKIRAKNRDWEDLTSDEEGNIYIGNFGNNNNDSKNLSILKVSIDSIRDNKKTITPEHIKFSYPDQKKFPPKKPNRHFDCESFFYFKDSLYLFTKSRSPKENGKTNLYKLPAKKGKYIAKFIASFNTCPESECWVTSADINKQKTKIALLTENSVFILSELNYNDLFNSSIKRLIFDYNSQKESVCFKNDSTLYIADEYKNYNGGNLYEFKIN